MSISFLATLLTYAIVSATVSSAASANTKTHRTSPQRIVSMSLASDEILSALLQNKQRLVAVSALAHNKQYSNIQHLSLPPQVATDIEKVINLQPDLVICSVFNQPQFIVALKALKHLQPPYLMLGKFTNISDILTNIMSIGKAVQADTQAKTLVRKLKQRLSKMNRRASNLQGRKPQVLNFFADYTIMGAHTMYDSIVKHAGADNVAATVGKSFAKISIETLVTLNPDYIIVPTGIYEHKQIVTRIKQMPGWKNLTAVKENRFIYVPAKELLATSQYAIKASEAIHAAFKQ